MLGFLPNCNDTANRASAYLTFSVKARDESVMRTRSLGQLLQDHSSQPENDLTSPVVTQLQPPMLPPPPYPSFKLVQSYTEVPPTNHPLLISESKPPKTLFVVSALTSAQYRLRERQTSSTLSQQQIQDGVVDTSLTGSDFAGPSTPDLPLAGVITESEKLVPQFTLKHSLSQNFDFLKSDSQTFDSHPVTPSSLQYGLLYPQSLTKRELQQSASMSNQAFQTKVDGSSQPVGWKTEKSDPEQSSTQSYFAKFDLEISTVHYNLSDQTIKSPVDSTSNRSETQTQPSPTSPGLPFTTAPPTTQPQHSQLQPPTPWTQTESFQDPDSNLPTHQPSSSSIYPSGQTSDSPSKPPLIPDVHQVNISNQVQLNISKQANSVNMTKIVNDTEITEWLKKNTSQSPMTSNDPRWEKQFEVLFLFCKCLNYMCQ